MDTFSLIFVRLAQAVALVTVGIYVWAWVGGAVDFGTALGFSTWPIMFYFTASQMIRSRIAEAKALLQALDMIERELERERAA